MTGDKRRSPRIEPFVAPCHVAEGARRFAGYLTDLSPEGGRVICGADPPAVDAWVVIEVRLDRRAGRQPLAARVKWSQREGPMGPMFGVTFESLDDDGRRALAGVVAEFQRRAADLR